MGTQVLNLPINIPWKLIAVSPDMMDTQFCDKDFPLPWRSSLAIEELQREGIEMMVEQLSHLSQ